MIHTKEPKYNTERQLSAIAGVSLLHSPKPAACDTAPVILDFESELRPWQARRSDTWLFVTLPSDLSEEIRELTRGGPRRGFRSVRVRATVGGTAWSTSIFPRKGRYTLSIKREIREALGLEAGAPVAGTVELLDL